ncbi:MAG: DUF3050 domain-containing protein [Candidatus Margulisiibacteriota bacterium]
MIQQVYDQILPYQEQLKKHPVYSEIGSIKQLVVFMSYHIYSVWDFMNLLKTLQNSLTCTQIPWCPPHSIENARLINEIVLEEESDIIDGKPTSHFMFYVEALNHLHYHPSIQMFLHDLNQGDCSYQELISKDYIPEPVQHYLAFSYDRIHSSILETASAFAFGREILVPLIFEPLLTLKSMDPKVDAFVRYLERHIVLDGEQHSQLAEQMIINLCKSDNDWNLVTKTAINALKSRLGLWDEIYRMLTTNPA